MYVSVHWVEVDELFFEYSHEEPKFHQGVGDSERLCFIQRSTDDLNYPPASRDGLWTLSAKTAQSVNTALVKQRRSFPLTSLRRCLNVYIDSLVSTK